MSKKKRYKNSLIFLGTGGGKNVMARQARRTGGIYIEMSGVKLVIDPGPGCLVHAISKKLKPETWDGVLLSHLHPDHSTDANVIIDCIAAKGKRKPFLVAEEHCIKPKDDYYPCISKFHQKLADVSVMKPGKKVIVNSLKITAVRADHYVPTLGFIIKSDMKIGYASDGTYYKGQEKGLEGCDVLILNVLVPKGEAAKKRWHMSVDEAVELVKKMKKKPRLIIIQHFSFWMLHSDARTQAKIIEKETGAKTIAAEDFMKIDLDSLRAGNT